jgi:hypothetical protein
VLLLERVSLVGGIFELFTKVIESLFKLVQLKSQLLTELKLSIYRLRLGTPSLLAQSRNLVLSG